MFKINYNDFYDIEGQKRRAGEINRMVIENHLKDIDENGKFPCTKGLDAFHENNEYIYRLKELLNFCQALLNSDEDYTEILELLLLKNEYFNSYATFSAYLCMLCLKRNKLKMTDRLINLFENHVKMCADFNLDDSNDFIAVNDNTPAMIAACLVLSGEYFKEPEWFNVGKKRLLQLKDMIERRGFISEYNSPTYTPITLNALAAIVNYAEDKEVRDIALFCEINIWKMKCALYFPSTCQTCGPYSRAYYMDKQCFDGYNRFLFYAVFGDDCTINVLKSNFTEDVDKKYNSQISNVFIANMEYHCPAKFVHELKTRMYPCVVRGTAETSPSADMHLIEVKQGEFCSAYNKTGSPQTLDEVDDLYQYSAGVIGTYSYLDKYFAMGTANRDWHNGIQTDNFHLMYSTAVPCEEQKQIGALFANYFINTNGIINYNDSGRKVAMQDKNTAMVLYRPKWCSEPVSSAGLQLIFSNYKNTIKEIRVGLDSLSVCEIQNKTFTYNKISSVLMDATSVYIMVYPLIAEKDRNSALMEISSLDDVMMLNIYNYLGEPKKFHKHELCMKTNGFLCSVVPKEETSGFDEFEKRYSSPVVEDIIRSNVHTRFTTERQITSKIDNLELVCCYSPLNDSIRYMTVNGELFENIKFSVDRKGDD